MPCETTASWQRFVESICVVDPNADVIEDFDTPHNGIHLGQTDPLALHEKGKRTLVLAEHKSAVRQSNEEGNSWLGEPTAFYLGKLQDGLALDPPTGYSRHIIPFFADHPTARLTLLTKSAVEAEGEGRKMDSTKFESIIGKYFGEGGVKISKVLVVTRQGFYQVEQAKEERLNR